MSKNFFVVLSLFVLLVGSVSSILGQADTTNIGYYNFVLIDSSEVSGRIVFEDENVIQLKLLSEGDIRFKKEFIVSQEFVPFDTTQTSRFELEGGSVLIGVILSESDSSVTVKLLSGNETTISKQAIINRTLVSSKIKNGKFWNDDPNETRLFFAPTGRRLKAGDGYFAVYEVFFPMVAIGVTDFLTLSGGISLFPGSSEQIFYLAPKIIIIQTNDYALSVGDFYVKAPTANEYLNIVYSVGTASFLNGSGAITGGIGYETYSKAPMILFGAELRISRYAKLITENWFIPKNDFSFASLGIRFLGEHLAADFGFIVPLVETNEIILFPWLGFAYNF